MDGGVIPGRPRYPEGMSTGEVREALRLARAVAALGPPIEVSRPLALFIGEMVTVLWKRDEEDCGQRRPGDLTGGELRGALGHAAGLLALRPRLGVQNALVDYTFMLMPELENRGTATGGHVGGVAGLPAR
jgi:hypothetical protein